MFYRRDVLKLPNLTVPRTWKNIPVAAAIQQAFEGKVLTGSCIGQQASGVPERTGPISSSSSCTKRTVPAQDTCSIRPI
jgi:hypothetical protein